MPEPKGPSDFVDAAYHLEDEASMVEFYHKWAQDYDHQMLDQLGYTAPTKIAQHLGEHLPNTDAAIFDVGCGTGLTCVYLAEKGYANLDGIDLSPDMVGVAGQRGIYRELLVGDVNQALERDDASYDGVVSSGTFTHGHVGPQPLDEIFRILKPGGILACTVHGELWESMGFRQKLDALVETGVALRLKQQLDSYYRDGPSEGWFCVYQKRSLAG
ncbi:MAG: class I SAM-dependent methyltransferase [Gammaproteobacteria bacterium]|nr:class I SAM-dependent methyltransferase [Gammaproteobacteria bacterium]